MSTDSAVSVSTATQVASSLPEVLQALGAFLNYPELRSCVLVCHQWNEVFTPWLWRIVEDYTLAWPRIIDQISPNFYSRYAVNNTVPSTKKDERWLRGMFVKHGRDVKGLHISSTPFLANASAAGTFTRLNSLTIHAITTYRPSEEAKALMDLPILAFKRNDDILLWDEQQAVISTCVLSPAFDNVLKPYAAMQLDAFPPCLMGSQRVCLLIMENPDLETVELGLETGVVAQFFSKEYVVGLLAALPRLKRFNNKCLQYDLQSMLEQLAGLQHYESHQHILNPLDFTLDNVALTRSFPGLRSLSLLGHGKVRAESVLNLLELLPGLEQLTLASLLPGLGNSSDSEEFIQDKKHGRLQGFHITYPVHNATRALDETISGLLPCMPFLTKISLRVLMPETAAVLAEQCKQLEGTGSCLPRAVHVV
ncbi:hypothetical protein BGW39_010102 [Mortierella sp. 14UC]|nr:hypothetical protein BGW39_010102 [Mortierella sp. 14UC]